MSGRGAQSKKKQRALRFKKKKRSKYVPSKKKALLFWRAKKDSKKR